MLDVDSQGYCHPSNTKELADLIKAVAERGGKLRVRGAEHSVPTGVYTADAKPANNGVDADVILDRMRSVVFDEATKQVTVGAGCNLGKDPDDPTKTSTTENSLTFQLQARGWALPITGGIIRQTVGGFVSTGSAGGSTEYSLGNQIVAIELVDGTGTEHTLTEPQKEFYAAGVSLGLLGVITSVTFQCEDTFNIEGMEITHQERLAHIELFATPSSRQPAVKAGDRARISLIKHFEEQHYARCMWWPQKHVRKIVFWQANRMKKAPAKSFPRRYNEFPCYFGNTWLAQHVVALLMRIFSPLNPPGAGSWFGRCRNWFLEYLFYGGAKIFLANGIKNAQTFQDTWNDGIPQDNRVDYGLMPTEFSEIWLPFEKTLEIMDAVRDHYEDAPISQVGTYAIDIYATPESRFWLSPAYGQKSIKFDILWFSKNRGDPVTDFFPQFWDLLKPLGSRFHWGKHMPAWPNYLRQQLPMWDEFMALRDQLDPKQVFVTDYWRERFGIPRPAASTTMPPALAPEG